jgi:hypothetical protein
LRKNPIARAGFIFYLILIHLWTFTLLFFHAHSFGIERCDFQSGVRLSHGPNALMMEQNNGVPIKVATTTITNPAADIDGTDGNVMIPNTSTAKDQSKRKGKTTPVDDKMLADTIKDAKADSAQIP